MKRKILITALALSITAALCACDSTSQTSTQQTAQTPAEQQTSAPAEQPSEPQATQAPAEPTPQPTEAPKKGKFNLEVYNQIETGMTYEQVVALIGSEPDIKSEAEFMGTKSLSCSWYGEGSFGANAVIQFTDNKVTLKSHFGLQ